MSVFEISTETIFDCHLQAAHLLREMRGSLDEQYHNAINIQMITASACYVEGYFESACRDLLAEYRTSRSRLEIDYPDEETRIRLVRFYQRLEDDLDFRLRRATGVEHYAPLIEVLMGEKLTHDVVIKDYFEGVTNLFSLRNMFAHGRLFEKSVLIRAPKMPEQDERTKLISGYDKVAKFLIKQKLIKVERAEIKLGDIASDTVADYFLELAESFCSIIPEFQERALYVPSVEEWLEDMLSELRDEYNEQHGTDFTGLELVRKGVISIQTESLSDDKEV
ncbi:MAG: hypothetical protein HFJ74_03215 [Eggerthellaceae bacterium]|jgi:hypothetical protein|nr:hypothetical protein [Eggerthellaceae bacterium]